MRFLLLLLLLNLSACSRVTEVPLNALDSDRVEESLGGWLDDALQGPASADLYFNIGHAYFAQEDFASAAAFWRSAHTLAPRDGDVSHNLALARTELREAARPVEPAASWSEFVTADEVGWLGTSVVVVGCLLVCARRRQFGATLLIVGVLIVLSAREVKVQQLAQPLAVVADAAAEFREAPRMDARRIATIGAGSEVRVLEERGTFLLVVSGNGRRGWIPRDRMRVVSLR